MCGLLPRLSFYCKYDYAYNIWVKLASYPGHAEKKKFFFFAWPGYKARVKLGVELRNEAVCVCVFGIRLSARWIQRGKIL